MMRRIQIFLKILINERRLPGKCYQAYFDVLHKAGFKTATTRVGRGVTLKGLTSCLSIAQEIWSKKVYDHANFAFAQNMQVIDIGANQGFFALYVASFGANVYAYEPSSENFAFLKHNAATNQCGSLIKPFRAAVAGKKGNVELFVGCNSDGEIVSDTPSITNTNRGGSGLKSETVEAVRLEDILNDNGIAECDFLKVDCEGGEYEILQTTSPETFKRIRRISMETHDGRGQEALDILKANGFRILDICSDYTGFIKAHRL